MQSKKASRVVGVDILERAIGALDRDTGEAAVGALGCRPRHPRRTSCARRRQAVACGRPDAGAARNSGRRCTCTMLCALPDKSITQSRAESPHRRSPGADSRNRRHCARGNAPACPRTRLRVDAEAARLNDPRPAAITTAFATNRVPADVARSNRPSSRGLSSTTSSPRWNSGRTA